MLIPKEELKSFIRAHQIRGLDDFNDILKQLSKDLLETLLEGELDEQLGYEKYDYLSKTTDNSRNGNSTKKVKTQYGKIELKIPRDRNSKFSPIVVKKGQNDITGLDEKIISMYGKGMTTRDIKSHIMDIYNYEISAETVSNITDKIIPKIKEWQNRQLESLYPIVFMDALVCKVRSDGIVKKKTIYGLIGIDISGRKDCLGLWISEGGESSKYWLSVLNELKNRGVKDVLIFSVDGLSGFSEAIATSFPESEVQRCIVHQVRNSIKHVSYKDRKEIAGDLKSIYRAPTEEAGFEALSEFAQKWDDKYSYISRSWDKNWSELSTFYKYSPEIRRLIYTTNPIESFNRGLRKTSKNRGAFPNDDAVMKLFYLSVMDMKRKWTMPIRNWSLIFSQLAVYFEERLKDYI